MLKEAKINNLMFELTKKHNKRRSKRLALKLRSLGVPYSKIKKITID
jgi:hypothetical protein